jgi:hypothetical protein
MGWVVAATPWQLYLRQGDPVPIVWEAGWAAGPVWTCEEILPPPWFDPRIFQPIASRYTDSYPVPAMASGNLVILGKAFKSNRPS